MKTNLNQRISRHSLWLAALIFSTSVLPRIADATVVLIKTNLGDVEVNLFDNDTPETVANFLFYVNNGRYTNSIIHRTPSPPGFVVQGGGFVFDSLVGFGLVPVAPPVINEPVFSNVRGTIAMAKRGGDANSATSQWFINLNDNSGGSPRLDSTNGGFTVFGQVSAEGMVVMDTIDALPRFDFAAAAGAALGNDFAGVFGELPLRNFPGEGSFGSVNETNLVIISAVTVPDTNAESAAGLNPVLNTANSGGGSDPVPPTTSGGGGGGFGFITLFALLLTYRFRRA